MPTKIILSSRDLSATEFARMKAGFDEHTLDNSVQVQTADRFGFVATAEDVFIGCSSGLAYKNDDEYAGWFYLTDLFVEKEFRGQNWGAKLLRALEEEIKTKGVHHIWTWTAGYEAPGFYHKQGYETFTAMENWYSDGSARVGVKKQL